MIDISLNNIEKFYGANKVLENYLGAKNFLCSKRKAEKHIPTLKASVDDRGFY